MQITEQNMRLVYVVGTSLAVAFAVGLAIAMALTGPASAAGSHTDVESQQDLVTAVAEQSTDHVDEDSPEFRRYLSLRCWDYYPGPWVTQDVEITNDHRGQLIHYHEALPHWAACTYGVWDDELETFVSIFVSERKMWPEHLGYWLYRTRTFPYPY